MRLRTVVSLPLLTFVTMACAHAYATETAPAQNSFDRVVAPILAAHCLECHRGAEPQGGLDLSQRTSAFRGGENGPAIVAGDPSESLVWQMIEAEDMPPKHPLPEAEKKIIREWISTGAKWGSDPIDPFQYSSSRRAGYDWWALQPLAKHAPPAAADDRWSCNDVDRFILAKLKSKGLAPSPPADPRTLVRRLYIDLIGLPPSPETIDAFVRDPSAAAWEQLVDDLLASKHYGERWARHWLDVARFGESDGYEYNSPRDNAWHYRDWVIRALNDDMPYDEFARMQLAGDILQSGEVSGAAATGFLVAGPHNSVVGNSPTMKAAARQDALEEIAGTVAQAFLGLTVNCARCHDHKFDPITMHEYYSFIAALDGVHPGEKTVAVRNSHSQRRKELASHRDEIRDRLVESALHGDMWKTSPANQVRTKHSIDANQKGERYRVSFRIAPSVWASASQATGERDGLAVSIVKEDGSVLAVKLSQPGAWNEGRKADQYLPDSFDYVGDGVGKVHVHIRPFPLHSVRFGGAIDDLAITETASQKPIFEESFENLQQKHAPGVQAHTGRPVYFLATSDHWNHSGLNALHAVEHSKGNFALQLFSGEGPLANRAETAEEKALQQEMETLNQELAALPAEGALVAYTVSPGKTVPVRVLLRGDVNRPADDVAPGGVKAIRGVPASFGLEKTAPDAQRRLALANWIAHRENGPFHRVIVNRVWHYHFGQGIVASPSDFGFNGGRPSHPELLDWLAIWFRDNGHSLKKLHKLLVTSATYQQASRSHTQGSAADVNNQFWWRQNPRRLEAEVLRDAMLEVAGALNRKFEGPGYRDVVVSMVAPAYYYEPIDPVGDEFNRRTIYRWGVRGQRSALLDTFDCPDPSTKTPQRLITTTPAQALSHWNHGFVLRTSQQLAERVERESSPKNDPQRTAEEKVSRLWRVALGRSPTNEERAKSVRLVLDHGLPLLCRVVLNSNEFLLID